jgi:type I restriction-modification system DNA methylase subunit
MSKPTSSDVINHVRNLAYMSGVDRDRTRIRQTGEVFTPTPLVQEILDQLDPALFSDASRTFLDPSCGDGQFLSEVLIRKVENGSTFEQALSTIYGVDIMPDNVALCRERLLCGQQHLRAIVERNIVCADALRYHYRFDGTDPYETEQDQIFSSLFE